MKHMIQQGDCLIKKCGVVGIFKKEFNSIPTEAKKVKGNLVLKGTTNSHALYGGKFELLTYEGTLFIKVIKETKLDHVKDHRTTKSKHAEHHAIKIEPGEYFFDGVMEYDHMKNERRQVID